MTNREWINSLSNEDFEEWLFGKTYYFIENGTTLKIGNITPTFHDILNMYPDARGGVRDWLKENKYDNTRN